ncbi:MAG: HEAT repeat domain-containing protein [Asgard group archaeon]|nr:HEAT repeat domain-containing protein [Asgard group archaeon]
MISLSSGCPISKNIELLSSDDSGVRRQAVEFLGKCMNKVAVKPLLELLETEKDLKVRRAIVLSISLLGSNDVLPILLHILENDSDLDTRRNAAGGLRFFGDMINGMELIELVLKETDESIRYVLVGTIIYLRDDSLIPKLLKLFESTKDVDIKGCILEIIGSFNDSRTNELLINTTAADSPEKLRLIATRSMGRLDEKELIPAIYEVYKNDTSEEIIECAGKFLEEFSLLLGFTSIDQMVLNILDSQQ